jgi:hypothetical protein
MTPPAAESFVPPQATTFGLVAGKSAWALPSFTPSRDPSSPAAQKTVTPSAPASWKAWSIACIACAVHCDSAAPQLIEMIDGARTWSWTAMVMASRKPRSVFGAKYTAMVAPGATAPATSMSSMTSPSALSGVEGEFCPPSTETAVIDGSGAGRSWTYVTRSAARKPPPSSMMAMHWPEPSAVGGKW